MKNKISVGLIWLILLEMRGFSFSENPQRFQMQSLEESPPKFAQDMPKPPQNTPQKPGNITQPHKNIPSTVHL